MAVKSESSALPEVEVPPLELYNDNDEEHRQLRKVPGRLPWMLFAVCVIEMGERFVYLGITGPLQNYIQVPYPFNDAGVPGALGRGQSVGVALGNFFKFWAYFCTILGAIVADQYFGKFKTIIASTPIYVIGMVILVATSTPVSVKSGAAMGGLVTAMITIGLGTGGLKSCIAPMCGEQTPILQSYVTFNKKGERVVIDAKLTSARVFMWYYWAANLGSLSSLATTNLEKNYGFWVAYLLPLVFFITVFIIFVSFSKKLVKVPPKGSPIVDAGRTIMIAIKEKGFSKAMPSSLAARGRTGKHKFSINERYTDRHVLDIQSGVMACKYFLLFPLYFLVWIQSFSNLVAQAGSMNLGNTPNDLMQSMETIFMLGFIPMLDLLVYPVLRKKFGISLNPILRVFLGFMCAALGMAYACVLQYFIYARPDNSIYVWIQAPAYIFLALSEIWVIITGLEVAFLKAPETLRAFVSSIFWITIAIGSAIGIAMSPVSKDPYMMWLYGSLAIAVLIAGCIFYVWFRDSIKGGPAAAGEDVLDGISIAGATSVARGFEDPKEAANYPKVEAV